MKQSYAIPVLIHAIVYVDANSIQDAEMAINDRSDYKVRIPALTGELAKKAWRDPEVYVDEVEIKDSK